MRRLSVFLLFLITLSANAQEIYPAGTRLSFSSDGEKRLHLRAVGPSVLWIRVEGGGLSSITASSSVATASSFLFGGWGEIILPVYESGDIEVVVRSTPGTRAVLASFYGVGDVVPALPVAPQAPVVPLISPPQPVEPPMTHPDVVVIEPVAPPRDETPVPLNDFRRSLFFGETVMGSNASTAVETFRVYIPNRDAFRLVLTGDYDARIVSEATGAEWNVFGAGPLKALTVPPPTDGYYLVSIRGAGMYSLRAESVR